MSGNLLESVEFQEVWKHLCSSEREKILNELLKDKLTNENIHQLIGGLRVVKELESSIERTIRREKNITELRKGNK